jgi:hypothetical protein
MSKVKIAEPSEASPATPATPENLSKLIEQAVAKEPNEQVRCVRVFNDRYRCNWWAVGKEAAWDSVTTSRIVRSEFLRATATADGLKMENLN